MDSFTAAIISLVEFLVPLCSQIVSGVVCAEPWLRDELARYGVTPFVQTILLLSLAAVLIVGIMRRFGGVVRAIALPVLILIATHIAQPMF